eukprot:scaffold63711_cov30-Phaeocystis_antarctica.AAC.2
MVAESAPRSETRRAPRPAVARGDRTAQQAACSSRPCEASVPVTRPGQPITAEQVRKAGGEAS